MTTALSCELDPTAARRVERDSHRQFAAAMAAAASRRGRTIVAAVATLAAACGAVWLIV